MPIKHSITHFYSENPNMITLHWLSSGKPFMLNRDYIISVQHLSKDGVVETRIHVKDAPHLWVVKETFAEVQRMLS